MNKDLEIINVTFVLSPGYCYNNIQKNAIQGDFSRPINQHTYMYISGTSKINEMCQHTTFCVGMQHDYVNMQLIYVACSQNYTACLHK